MIKVAFLGTPYIGAAALKSLLDEDSIEVVVVVTTEDKAVGRSHSTLQQSPVADMAERYELPIIKTNSINNDIGILKEFEFDYMLTCAFGQFLSDEVLALPKKKALNVHGSLLPEGRGGAPLHWAIIEGKKKTGISIMEMVSKMDAGDYYSQYELEIGDNDNTEDLFKSMSNLILEKTAQGIIEIESGKEPTKQDESKVTFWMNVKRNDAKIDFNNNSIDIHNRIRGVTPNPGAWSNIGDKVVKMAVSSISEETSTAEPGTIFKIDDLGAHISTKDKNIIIKEMTLEGSKKTIFEQNTGQHFLNKVIK